MRRLSICIARPVLCLASITSVMPAAHAETPLQVTLGPGYAIAPDFDFSTIAAPAGSVLTFSLVGEATGWAATQTFSVIDGNNTIELFDGPASAGAQVRYLVHSGIDGVSFDTHSGDAGQFAPGGADADFWVLTKRTDGSASYAFAYEDFHYGVTNDHNDMVIGLSVASPVPEAGTLAMLLSGLGVMALRRRRPT